MQNGRFYKTPFGAQSCRIPHAEIAQPETSKTVVPDSDPDSFFFRALERQNIWLNPAQIEAVRHFKGPCLTLAGAGSGKTSVLVCRTGYLLSVHKIQPQHILLVTFTRKAAQEMKERVARLPGLSPTQANQITASTFHAFFLKILRFRGYQQAILSSEREKQVIVKKILKEMGLQDSYQPETLLSIFSSFKINLVSMDEIPDQTSAEKEIRQAFLFYESWKRENGKLDFDDILAEAYHLLQRDQELLHLLQNRFQFVMVDEFQDTNLIQYELIKMLTMPHRNLFVVGDDDQTIFTFNGAQHRLILDFDQEFPEAKTILLDMNYRSHSGIVGLANWVIRGNLQRRKKILKAARRGDTSPFYFRPANADEEAEIVVQHILEQVNSGKRSWNEIAVLYRTSSNSRALVERLLAQKIPFVDYSSSDQTFYESWITKPVVDHLRLALNPADFSSIEGILSTLYVHREIGMEWIRAREQLLHLEDPILHLADLPHLKDFQKAQIRERVRLIHDIARHTPLEAIRLIRARFYDQYLEANERVHLTVHREIIQEHLDELEASAKRFETIRDFILFIDQLAKTVRDMEERKKENPDQVLSLMTIHRAKGLEFPVVYLIGASEGIMPHDSAIRADQMEDRVFYEGKQKSLLALEEERRIMYVAITRAKEELYISSPSFYRGKQVQVSRFLLEAFTESPASKKGSQPCPNQHHGRREVVLAWICTGEHCIAWQRILSHEEAQAETKKCPLCGATMKQGKKEIM